MLHAKLLCDASQFVKAEPLPAPRDCERFDRDVETDLVPETKAVRNRAREAVDANGLAFDAMLLNAKSKHGCGNVDDPQRRCRYARHTRATGNGNPDFGWKLRSDVMEPEGRDQADHRPWDGGRGDRQVVVLGGPSAPGQPISARTNLFKNTRLCYSGQCASVNALTSYVAGPQDRLSLSKAEKFVCGGSSTSRRFAYTHSYL
ncbi:MAG TPA: hypothetical protein VFX12_16115 [Vicinamibacterales bacterium]|nr:hypothetical protein [Vicinamibacterales bacterium]